MSELHKLIPDLDRQLKADAKINAEIDRFMENVVVPEWKELAPVDTGEYRDSIKVTKWAVGLKGRVSATDDKANLIEYGTEDTPEFAPRARLEAHFNHRGPAAL